MAQIILTSALCDRFTQGQEQLDIDAPNVMQLVRELDRRFPGIGEHIETRISIAVDGAIITDWRQPLTAASEVFMVPRIAGGYAGAIPYPW